MAKLNQFESIYKRHSREMEIPPPTGVWERVESTLDARKTKRKKIWFWSAAAAAVFIGIITMSVLFPLQDNSTVVPQYTHREIILPTQPSPFIIDTPSYEKSDAKESDRDIHKVSDATDSPVYDEHKNDLRAHELIHPGDPGQEVSGKYVNNVQIIPKIKHTPDRPFFTTKKVKVQDLIAQNSFDRWQERFNVDHRDISKGQRSKPEASQRKFHIGGSVSPVYSFRQTTGNPQMISPSFTTNHSYQEKGVLHAGGGLNLNLQLNNRWSVESGLRYARMGQEVHTAINSERAYALSTDQEDYGNVTLKQVSLNNSMGAIRHYQPPQTESSNLTFSNSRAQSILVDFGTDDSVNEGQLEQLIDYIEIPMTLRYYVIDNHIKISLAAGFSTNWLISNNVHLRDGNERHKIGDTEGVSSMNWSTHAGLNFAVPVFGPFSLSMEPRINYFLTDINQHFPVKFRPYSFGVYSGIQYTIGD